MHELEFEKLTEFKNKLEIAINDENYLDADDLLSELWEKIEDWYWHEKHPTHVYVADVCSKAVHKAIEEQQGAQAENHARLFTRDWRCPYCGRALRVEYIQDERYLVKCGCRPVRIQYVRADSPDKAAARVGIPLLHVDDGPDDYVVGVWWPTNQIEEPPHYVGSPLDTDFPWDSTPNDCGEAPTDCPQAWWGMPLPHISQRFPDDAENEYNQITGTQK